MASAPPDLSDERKAEVAFERLHLLCERGYRPTWNSKLGDSVWLRHPLKQTAEREVILYSFGKVASTTSQWECYAEEPSKFNEMLRKVKKPSWWSSWREERSKFYGSVGSIILVLMFFWLIRVLLEAVWPK